MIPVTEFDAHFHVAQNSIGHSYGYNSFSLVALIMKWWQHLTAMCCLKKSFVSSHDALIPLIRTEIS